MFFLHLWVSNCDSPLDLQMADFTSIFGSIWTLSHTSHSRTQLGSSSSLVYSSHDGHWNIGELNCTCPFKASAGIMSAHVPLGKTCYRSKVYLEYVHVFKVGWSRRRKLHLVQCYLGTFKCSKQKNEKMYIKQIAPIRVLEWLPDETDFKTKEVTGYKGEHFMIKKRSSHPENTKIMYMYL